MRRCVVTYQAARTNPPPSEVETTSDAKRPSRPATSPFWAAAMKASRNVFARSNSRASFGHRRRAAGRESRVAARWLLRSEGCPQSPGRDGRRPLAARTPRARLARASRAGAAPRVQRLDRRSPPGSALVSIGSGSHGPTAISLRDASGLDHVDRESRGRRHQERQRIADRTPIGGLPPNPDVLHDVFGLRRAAQHPIGDAKQPRPGTEECREAIVGRGEARRPGESLSISITSVLACITFSPSCRELRDSMTSALFTRITPAGNVLSHPCDCDRNCLWRE